MIKGRIDPVKTSQDLRETYLRYLITAFGLRDECLAQQFRELARHSKGLFRGPVLEATPKYKRGKSLTDLIIKDNSILSTEFFNYAPGLTEKQMSSCLSMDRHLYSHQEKALRKTIGENRNIVVSTGTGSGKTECFLFPIIDYLLKERSENRLRPGVRALIMYPMNALANDQVLRLRKMLPPETGITFGRYTGHTKQTYIQGLDSYRQENVSIPQANELFCRDQILGKEPVSKKEWPHQEYEPFVGPPHILLTNFAMLEYLLMRPQDSFLFDNSLGDTWRFLVLDEAHIYTGAQGTEISYLIRRLKDRVCQSRQGKLLCIATSATIGANDSSNQETIAESFSNLFGEHFDKHDIITADTIPLESFVKDFPEWGEGSSHFYQSLYEIIQSDHLSREQFIHAAKEWFFSNTQYNVPAHWPNQGVFLRAIDHTESIQNPILVKEAFLFHLLAGDLRIRKLVRRIETEPYDLKKIADDIWGIEKNEGDTEAAQINLTTIVELASRARLAFDTAPLLSARYHFFVRSLEGLSIYFSPIKNNENISLKPILIVGRHREILDTPDGPTVAFELQACGRCGQPYLRGHLSTEEGRFISYPSRKRLNEDPRTNDYFAIYLDRLVESSEDEDPLRDETPPTSESDDEETVGRIKETRTGQTNLWETQYICSRCGFLADDKVNACPFCKAYNERISYEWIPVRRVSPSSGNIIKVCPACGAQKYYGGSIIRAFSPGDDAAGAVLAQCLVSNIPRITDGTDHGKGEEKSVSHGRFHHLVSKTTDKHVKKGKRRLLAFSDSRQDAAYFATYLNRTANQILHRQLMLRAIKRFLEINKGITTFDANDLINPLIFEAQESGLFDAKDTEGTKVLEVNKWINGELANIQRRNGLEGVGLISWRLKCRDKLIELARCEEDGLKKDYLLNHEEFITLLEIFLGELRRQNVLQPIKNVRIQDPYFWPRNRPYTIRKNDVNGKLSIASWFPQSSRNIRSDYIERLYQRMGHNISKDTVRKILEDIWSLSMAAGLNIWEEVQSVIKLWRGAGADEVAWRLRWDAWLGSFITSQNVSLFKCDICGNISEFNLKGTCPIYRCNGNLFQINPDEEFAHNHYRYLYTQVSPIPILSQEHTAQITTQEGAERQQKFSDDHDALNVLSCSTTFELGVDVGQLHSVFLRNVPPGIANYVQRAGRAGRRWSAAAYVLTFCRSRPHDIGHFQRVEELISGKVQPPRVQIDNVRIARRHAHSVILSRFWRFHYPEMFNGPEGIKRGIVQWLFLDPNESGASCLYNWIMREPEELRIELERIFPLSIREELGIPTWAWVSELVSPPNNDSPEVWEGHFGLAQSELLSEHKAYEQLQKTNPKLYNYADRQMRRLRERQILGFLASRNVLPKYGFPVDVVSLKIESKDEWAQSVELDRDLKIALSEYAPGCTLVANGRIVKSYALEKITGKAWPEYRFAVCNSCGKFYRSKSAEDPVPDHCECGQSLDDAAGSELQGRFVEPAFGFRTFLEEDGQEPVEVKPQRTFASRVLFSHYRVAEQEPFVDEGSSDPLSGIHIQKRYSRYGVLAVINSGKMKRGFWLCYSCGFGDAVASGKPENHKTPWGKICNGKPKRVFLGHEFHSDVLEIRFSGGLADINDQGFWLSLTASLLAGASKALDIERDDIDGTVLSFGGQGKRAIVLFDSVPGGAGHVRRISFDFQKVVQAAFEIVEGCTSCSRDQSCNSCLRNYRNQYAHDLLKRGPVADFLKKVLNSVYLRNPGGFISLGITDAGQWLGQHIRRAQKVDFVLDDIFFSQSEKMCYKECLKAINEIANKGKEINLFFSNDPRDIFEKGEDGKVILHSLSLLCEMPNVDVLILNSKKYLEAKLYAELEGEAFAIRWPNGSNPFGLGKEVELSTLSATTEKIKNVFKGYKKDKTTIRWGIDSFEDLLQGTKVIPITKGSKKDWKNILDIYLPKGIEHVHVYDRFIRNKYQLKSLEMFLDALAEKKSKDGVVVEVLTTSDDPEHSRVNFKDIQERYKRIEVILRYVIQEPAKELPHYRKVIIKAKDTSTSLWLDRGLDIFHFEDVSKPTFETLESYVVISNN